MSKITPEVQTLSDKLAKAIKIEVKDGAAKTTVEADQYLANLPEGLTEAQIKLKQNYDGQFFAAASKAFGEAAIPVLKKHKDIDQISAAFPLYGKDAFSVSMDRSKTYPNPAGGEPSTTYGVLSAKLETQAARANRGLIKHIREELSESALKAFGG